MIARDAKATTPEGPILRAPFGRHISDLRLSVTDRCDFRCAYSMPENMAFLPKKDILTLEEMDRLASAFVERGVSKLRVTGGVIGALPGVVAAKRTHDLIPLCHPLALTEVTIEFEPDEAISSNSISATVKASEQTGVEMEALTAVSVAGPTICDMVKAVDRGMEFSDIR